MSLVVCGLSVSGSCFGNYNTSVLSMDNASNNKMVGIESSSKNFHEVNSDVDFSKVKVVDANENFLRDLGKVEKNQMSSYSLARKYGTRDGVVYRVGDRNVFLSFDNSSKFVSYHGDPLAGLEQGQETYQDRENLRRLQREVEGLHDYMIKSMSHFSPFFRSVFDKPMPNFYDFFPLMM